VSLACIGLSAINKDTIYLYCQEVKRLRGWIAGNF
jgi:hypothetical protein